MQETTFGNLTLVPKAAGYYEIYLHGCKLKCGIAVNLLKRLRQHLSSGGLRLKEGRELGENGKFRSPDDVVSKSSVLAKHLYFDQALKPGFDFCEREARRNLLLDHCLVRFLVTKTKDDARIIERKQEKEFRYCGRVVVRPTK